MQNNLNAPSSFIDTISSSLIEYKQPDFYWKCKSEPDLIIFCTRYQCLNYKIHKINESCCIENSSLEHSSTYEI